ncbi:hypothetical protein [Thermoactinospora rubra]|uniref:hypothetical protein n=1 Tax=Thermoactinospora rubra TaxID=1088767 RepID=UPI000A11EE11|nr:hypothetical protein [Thermoactinospora rubra]
MPSDPDHVLDAIDGAVEDWEAVSADAMRWAPPERKPSPSGDVFKEVTDLFAPLTAALRSLGEAVLEAPPVRRLFEFVEDVPLPSEPTLDVDDEEPTCRCLCFRHADSPGVCTGRVDGVFAGVQMCAACMEAQRHRQG